MVGAWRAAARHVGIDPDELTATVEGLGAELLLANLRTSHALNIQSSPTLYIDGRLYRGPMARIDLAAEIAAAFETVVQFVGVGEIATELQAAIAEIEVFEEKHRTRLADLEKTLRALGREPEDDEDWLKLRARQKKAAEKMAAAVGVAKGLLNQAAGMERDIQTKGWNQG